MAAEEPDLTRDLDDTPELLKKLQERKVRHKQRHPIHRAGVVVLGVFIVLAGIVMSGPGVPGPGHRGDHHRAHLPGARVRPC